MKAHTLDGNIKVRTFLSPPPAFDPLNASKADLMKYGFPAVPENQPQRELYHRLFKQMKGRFRYIEPTFGKPNKRRGGQYKLSSGRSPSPPGVQAGNEIGNIWSGGVVYAPPGKSFRWVTAAWTIPNVAAPAGDGDYYSAVWIGIDGDMSGGAKSTDVLQAGVNCDVSRSNGKQNKPTFSLWWEWYSEVADTGQIPITNFPISPGDTLSVTICTQGAGSTEALVFVANITEGIGTSHLAEPVSGSGVSLLGDCAEWIVERPLVDQATSSLADYGQVFFSGCTAAAYAGDGTSEIVDAGTGNYIDMYSVDTLISHGVLVAPTVVECVYMGDQ